ncbi:hypothetical protein CTheo_472 [Ceratobasidium theobromae]|uniref:Coiled-coil domain-containing protein n=1 Tax=Ceratobasidium theobromae TaxID=1582974 RepID=A0A5N5QWS5_9AGAM|nr:hypothetical protein CTheo_472 [Ceratobasidium theobromae]
MSNSQSSSSKKQSVNATTFFDLKAELAKQEDAFAKSKLAGKGKAGAIVGGLKRPDKKTPAWARPNKGVRDRARRDVELEQVNKPTLESARAALERKAQIYEKLQKGQGAGLSEKQREALLIDFDNRESGNESDSSEGLDRDQSLTVARAPGDDDDPIIEFEDEFGRLRTARRSQVPRDRLPENVNQFTVSTGGDDGEDPDVVYGRATHFPVYEPTAEQRAAVEASLVEESPYARYDASKENRATGAAFYQFSADEETRQQQMEELKQARVETVQARADLIKEDMDMIGPQVPEAPTTRTVSRAVEKRRRELEERRKMLEAKRRKMLGGDDRAGGADAFLASLEKELFPNPAAA